jgi:ribosomal protein RSM22 (predicted rRNA methylase)
LLEAGELGTEETKLIAKSDAPQGMTTPKVKYEAQHAFGYTLKRMPSTYGVLHRILSEVKARYPMEPIRALDYGAGTGSGVWALKENFPNL